MYHASNGLRLALTMELSSVTVPMGILSQGDQVKRLVEFPLDQGGSIVVEVDEPPAGR